jgi:uncharacterized protein (DUF58 family)
VNRPNREIQRRLTPLGARLLFFGVLTTVFAAAVGGRPLLVLGLGTALLPILSLATLPRPAGLIHTRMPIRMQAGAPARMHVDHIRANGRSGAPLLIMVEIDGWAPLTAWSEAQAENAKACVNFQTTPPTRGILRRWRVVTVARDPLGLAAASVTWMMTGDRPHIVHPATVPAPAVPLRPTTDVPEFSGLRAWQPSDRPRDVDWRATARRPSTAPVVRLWSETPSRGGEMVIGVAGGPDDQSCDRVAEITAAAVRDAFRRCEQVTLRWTGGEVTSRLAEPLLDALAEVPVVGMAAPTDCDLLVVPSTAAAAGAAAVWRVDGSGRVVAA